MGGVYGGILGLVAFATTVTHSLINGGGAESTLQSAVIFLFLFGGIGLLVGRLAEWTIEDALRSRLRDESGKEADNVGRRSETE